MPNYTYKMLEYEEHADPDRKVFASNSKYAAERAVEDYCHLHVDWSQSPYKVRVFDAEGQKWDFEVDIEAEPVFTARQIRPKEG